MDIAQIISSNLRFDFNGNVFANKAKKLFNKNLPSVSLIQRIMGRLPLKTGVAFVKYLKARKRTKLYFSGFFL